MHADVRDAFLAAVLREAERVVLGDPFDDKTLLGPLNNESVAAKMDRHMDDARARGRGCSTNWWRQRRLALSS